MKEKVLAIAMTIAFSSVARAQEVGVFISRGAPGLIREEATARGVTAAAFARIARLAGPLGNRPEIGVRIALSESNESGAAYFSCNPWTLCQQDYYRTRRVTTDAILAIAPYAARHARIELGVGATFHSVSRDVHDGRAGILASSSLAIKLPLLPVWFSGGFEHRKLLPKIYMADGTSYSYPANVTKIALSVRR